MSAALTKSRCTNLLKCYGNYALSLLGLVRISHAPLFASVEPASVCQLRCPECPVGSGNPEFRNSGFPRLMSREVWQRTLSEVRKSAWGIQFFFQGEPLLHPDLPTMIREAHDAGLYIIVSTNAQALTFKMADALVRAGLNRIIVSMDGLTEESYNAYRVGGNLEKTKAALRYLREAKNKFQISNFKFQIELQCLRLRTNEHEWQAFQREYRALGADRLVFKTAQLYDYQNGHPLMPTNPRYSRYIQGEDGHYHLRRRPKTCWRAWSGCVITTAGEVLPCCYDKSHAHAYGNIMNTPLRELFCSAVANTFRRAALHHQPQICKECWK